MDRPVHEPVHKQTVHGLVLGEPTVLDFPFRTLLVRSNLARRLIFSESCERIEPLTKGLFTMLNIRVLPVIFTLYFNVTAVHAGEVWVIAPVIDQIGKTMNSRKELSAKEKQEWVYRSSKA